MSVIGSSAPPKLNAEASANDSLNGYVNRCGASGRLRSSGLTGPANAAVIDGSETVTPGMTPGDARSAGPLIPSSDGLKPSTTTNSAGL